MKTNRFKVDFVEVANDNIPQLVFNDNSFLYKSNDHEDVVISFDKITKIKISLVDRIYNPSVGILEDGFKGLLSHRNAGQFSIYFNYYFDLDIYSDQGDYFFESSDLEEASKCILGLPDKLVIEDNLKLINLFRSKPFDQAHKYIDENYKKWANKFDLDNPRTTLDPTMVKLVEAKLNK